MKKDIHIKKEIVVENNNILTRKYNGKQEFFNQQGDITKVEYYKKGEKVPSSNN